jgi:hypothetical protein
VRVGHFGWRRGWQGLGFGVAREDLHWSRTGLGRLLLRWRWRWARRRSLCLEEVEEVLCQVSLSSHGKVVDPSLGVAVVGIAETGEDLVEVRSLCLKMTCRDSVAVLMAAHTQVSTSSHILVVVLVGSDISQLAQGCAFAVVDRCSRYCWIADFVDCVLNSDLIARHL